MEREAIVRFLYLTGLRFAGGLAPTRATLATFRLDLGLAASALVDLIVIVLLSLSAQRRKRIDVVAFP